MARVLEVPVPDDLMAILDARAGHAGMNGRTTSQTF
jgi:hypothetical protein